MQINSLYFVVQAFRRMFTFEHYIRKKYTQKVYKYNCSLNQIFGALLDTIFRTQFRTKNAFQQSYLSV